MSDALAADPRTAWAAYVYQGVPHNPPLSSDEASVVLGWLGPLEHAEVIGRGNPTRRHDPARFDDFVTGVAVRTMERGLLILPGQGDVWEWQEGAIRSSNKGAELAPQRDWSTSFSDGNQTIQFFTPTAQIKECLEEGAGQHILRLPHRPELPEPPDLERTERRSCPVPGGRLFLTGWESVEEAAVFYLRAIGFGDACRTPRGADEGLDVIGADIAAQVKQTALPVGRPVLQQLLGANTEDRGCACFSTSGYSAQAEVFARLHDVALFGVAADGRVTPVNSHGERLEREGTDNDQSDQWAAAHDYADGVRARIRPFLIGPIRPLDSVAVRTTARAVTYLRGAAKMWGNHAGWATPHELVAHFNHCELLLATWMRFAEGEYPEHPKIEPPPRGVADFY